jgi:hypothetical protein
MTNRGVLKSHLQGLLIFGNSPKGEGVPALIFVRYFHNSLSPRERGGVREISLHWRKPKKPKPKPIIVLNNDNIAFQRLKAGEHTCG